MHIPFCTVKCSYCAFNVYANLERLIPSYVEALSAEITIVGRGAAESGRNRTVRTVYLGGGTPSLLTLDQLGAILGAVRMAFDIVDDAEISLEVNPENQERAYFAGLRALGVNRLSIGMQSIRADELRLYARQHGPAATTGAVEAARAAGFENISLDLIYGSPRQTIEAWGQTLDATLTLRPDHISLYALQLEPGTPLAAQVDAGRLPRPDDDLAADMYELAGDRLLAEGFDQYEISSFARPGRQCAHNRQYWQRGEYLGLGAGAHGFAAETRYTVTALPRTYITRIQGATPLPGIPTRPYPLSPAVESTEMITIDDAMDETLITGLRLLQEGVAHAAFKARFGQSIDETYPGVISRLMAEGLLTDDGQAVRLTRRARLIANRALVHFMRG